MTRPDVRDGADHEERSAALVELVRQYVLHSPDLDCLTPIVAARLRTLREALRVDYVLARPPAQRTPHAFFVTGAFFGAREKVLTSMEDALRNGVSSLSLDDLNALLTKIEDIGSRTISIVTPARCACRDCTTDRENRHGIDG